MIKKIFLALAAPTAPRPLNFVFLDICSARADHFGAYGYRRDTTPQLDRLVKRAAIFDNAMAQSSWCLPNYAALFTGQRPENNGLYVNVPNGIPPFETTLAQRLKKNGYRTAAFSGGVYEIPAWGLSKGFDEYVSAFSTSVPNRTPAPVEDNMEAVGHWLKKAKGQKPFFLYLAIDNLHVPYHTANPAKYDPDYRHWIERFPDAFGVPFDRAYNGESSGYAPEIAAEAARFKKNNDANLKSYTARYDAAVNDVDAQISRLVKTLKKDGLYQNTVLFITGDHGEMLGEHGLLGHTQGLYQGVLHVPLIIRDPAAPGSFGRRYSELIERVDMMPTILSMAGVNYHGMQLSGRSFLPALEGRPAIRRQYAFANNHRDLAEPAPPILEERAAWDQRWKLIDYLYENNFKLYDLKNDPAELHDLSRKRPDIAARLAFELIRNMELSRPHQPGPPFLEPPPRSWSLTLPASRDR